MTHAPLSGFKPGFNPLANHTADDSIHAMPDATPLPYQRIKRQARKRTLRTLYTAIGVGMVFSLILAGVLYWFYHATRFRH